MSTREDRSVLLEAASHTHSESDRLAYGMDLLLLAHPEWCSTEADYPGWVPPHTEGTDFARSVRDGFLTPVSWDDEPVPVCDPQPAPARLVQDVAAGDLL